MQIDVEHKVQRILGLDELEIQSVFKKFALKSTVFVDIGASDGYYGLIYRKLNPSGKIFLCDANERFESIQLRNFTLNCF